MPFLSSIHPKRKGKDISEEDAEKIYKNIFEVIKKGKEFGGASELSFVHLDGKKVPFMNTSLCIKEKDKSVSCAVVLLHLLKLEVGARIFAQTVRGEKWRS